MNKNTNSFKRILSVLLAFTMLGGLLTACGGGKKGNGEGLSEFVYVPTYTNVPKEVSDISNPYLSGDTVYFNASVPIHADGTQATQAEVDAMYNGGGMDKAAYESTTVTNSASGTTISTEMAPSGAPSTTAASDITYKTFLFAMNKDGSNYHKLADYAPIGSSGDENSSSNIDKLIADDQGNVWVAESINKTIFNLPADFNPATQDKWQYYVSDERQSIIRKLSSTGAELAKVDLSQYVEKSEEADQMRGDGFYINNMLADKTGNIYISDGNSTVYAIGPDATFLFKVSVDDYLSGLIKLKDGTVGATTYMQNGNEGGGMVLKMLDVNAKAWGKDYSVPSNAWNTSDGGDKYDFCYTDSSSLYGYDLAASASEKLLTWINSDVDGDSVRFSTVLSDGNVFAISNNYSDDGAATFEIITLTKTPRSEVKQKKILTLATMWMDYNLKKELLKFNKTNADYRIEITDYSEFNTEKDYTAGITKLNTEIISGNVPDMIDISQLPYKQYAAKGLLEDLYPLIESDKELSRDDLMPGIMKAIETDGKLYQLVSSFYVMSLVGAPSVVGNEMGWTMDEMQKIIADHPEADYPFGMYMTRDNILDALCMLNMDSYMNWQTGECKFDSDEFKKLITFAKSFPEKVEESQDGTYTDPATLIHDGRQLFDNFSAGDFQNYQYTKATFGGAVTFKGFPTESGSGNVAMISGGLAMTSSCKAKDGAWQFMRTLLTEDYQDKQSWGFPLSQKAYDKKLAEAMKQEYNTDENGNQVKVSHGGMSIDGGATVEFYAVTQEEADQIKALIDSVDRTVAYDQNLLNIIKEESAFFFSGEKTVDQTAEVIQSRMTIYINEQR